jgi:hypothetical protein
VAPEAGTEIAVVPKPSADTADRIAWVKGYKGGDCFSASVDTFLGTIFPTAHRNEKLA